VGHTVGAIDGLIDEFADVLFELVLVELVEEFQVAGDHAEGFLKVVGDDVAELYFQHKGGRNMKATKNFEKKKRLLVVGKSRRKNDGLRYIDKKVTKILKRREDCWRLETPVGVTSGRWTGMRAGARGTGGGRGG
jgi:hypothetical protein